MSRISRDLEDSAHHPNGTNSTMQPLRMATGKVPSVAIVGAGISGLRCADVLIRNGAQVRLFEARDRVGGRVHQMESGGYLMDMGPNWIHGTNGNPIMKLAAKTKTAILDSEEDEAVFDSEGKRRSDIEAAEMGRTMWGTIVKAFKFSDEHSAEIDPKQSLYDYFKRELSKTIKDEKKLSDALYEAQSWGPFVGDPIERQSLKFFFLEECIDGENVFVAGTYKDILREISKTAIDHSVAEFNTEVTNINTEGPGVSITTAKGDVYIFDEVVVTCPLGWLKRNKATAFSPPFPPRLSQAVENINYGRLEKLYITFPSAFWLNDSNSTSPSPSNYPIFTHFHTTTTSPPPPCLPWNQSLVSLAHLPAPNAHPTLLFYIYGPCATHLTSLIAPHTPSSPTYNALLTTFAQPFYSLLPNYSPTSLACTPTAFLATQWQNDRFAGNGSYCNFQVGLEHGDEDIMVMRDAGGMTGQGLWLAGEHTAPFVALGTTTGAWWSGEGVARRICGKWGLRVHEEEGMGGLKVGGKELNGERGDVANLNGLAI